jgi:hypothetical protein
LTPEQHNKYLGWAHLAHGGLFLLMILGVLSFMTAIFLLEPPGRNGSQAGFLAVMWVFFAGFYGLMLAPSFIAGYALLKRKPWAKIAAIIGGVTAAMSFPIGTAVCAYTFWFLFSEPGKLLYDRPQAALPPQSINWQTAANQSQREAQYVPPPTPPDWR